MLDYCSRIVLDYTSDVNDDNDMLTLLMTLIVVDVDVAFILSSARSFDCSALCFDSVSGTYLVEWIGYNGSDKLWWVPFEDINSNVPLTNVPAWSAFCDPSSPMYVRVASMMKNKLPPPPPSDDEVPLAKCSARAQFDREMQAYRTKWQTGRA
jgi:hypothetical protein